MNLQPFPAGSATAVPCDCIAAHLPRRVVLTGGPGAGKTAVLELVKRSLCQHIMVLPEAAGVVFGGGFPRHPQNGCRRSAQRAIYFVQRELESCSNAHNPAIVLCDRGTLDGLAYWPSAPETFWSSLDTTLDRELSRYDAVVHLCTPPVDHGYNRSNPLRTESAATAAEIDDRILAVWSDHPRRFVVEASASFLDKAARALELLRLEVPPCCGGHLTLEGTRP